MMKIGGFVCGIAAGNRFFTGTITRIGTGICVMSRKSETICCLYFLLLAFQKVLSLAAVFLFASYYF